MMMIVSRELSLGQRRFRLVKSDTIETMWLVDPRMDFDLNSVIEIEYGTFNLPMFFFYLFIRPLAASTKIAICNLH